MLHKPPTVRGGRPHRCTRIDSNRRDLRLWDFERRPFEGSRHEGTVSLEIEPEGGESEKAL
jgi:hypothetical protein